MATMHRLRIGHAVAHDHIDGDPRQWDVFEFLIDDRPLSGLLGINRDLGFFATELDAPPPLRGHGLALLLGLAEPGNQFGSGRLVLYRCHCGSDYCGVISCRLRVEDDHVIWQDVTFEDDDGPASGHNAASSSVPRLTHVPRLLFERRQYEQALERHFAR